MMSSEQELAMYKNPSSIYTRKPKMTDKTSNFTALSNFFNKYPTGKLVSYLEDKIELEVMLVMTLEHMRSKDGVAKYVLLVVPSGKDGNVYNECVLAPFDIKEYPDTEWVFLKPDGTVLKTSIETKLVEDIIDG